MRPYSQVSAYAARMVIPSRRESEKDEACRVMPSAKKGCRNEMFSVRSLLEAWGRAADMNFGCVREES